MGSLDMSQNQNGISSRFSSRLSSQNFCLTIERSISQLAFRTGCLKIRNPLIFSCKATLQIVLASNLVSYLLLSENGPHHGEHEKGGVQERQEVRLKPRCGRRRGAGGARETQGQAKD